MIQHSDRRALEQSKRALGTRKEKRKFIGEDPIKGKAPFSSYGAANQCSKSRFSTILCKTPIDNWIFQTIPDTSYHSEWNTINLSHDSSLRSYAISFAYNDTFTPKPGRTLKYLISFIRYKSRLDHDCNFSLSIFLTSSNSCFSSTSDNWMVSK